MWITAGGRVKANIKCTPGQHQRSGRSHPGWYAGDSLWEIPFHGCTVWTDVKGDGWKVGLLWSTAGQGFSATHRPDFFPSFILLYPIAFSSKWNLSTSQMTFAGIMFCCLDSSSVYKPQPGPHTPLKSTGGYWETRSPHITLYYLIIWLQFLREGNRDSKYTCRTPEQFEKP